MWNFSINMELIEGKHCFLKILVFTFILNFIPVTASTTSEIEAGQDEAASGEQYANNLQDNYQIGFIKILEFVDSVAGNLSKINQRFDDLERVVNEKYEELAFRLRNAEESLSTLQIAKKGNTFNGSTVESISAAVPNKYTLTVQIVNSLDAPLLDYKLHLPYGKVFNQAPQSIPANTREVFTFKSPDSSGRYVPEGAFSYKLGDQNFDLHLYFFSGVQRAQIATAFLPRGYAVDTIYEKSPTWSGKPGWPYVHTGYVDLGTVRTTAIQKDGIHANITFQSELAAKVKVEVFRK